MGGGIIRWAVSRPVSVTVGVVLVILFGALSVKDIPIQLTPDVTVPSISVTTVWPGASPKEIESEILEDQEKALKSLPGLERMTSTANRNQGQIELELAVGSSLDEALVRVSNLLSQVSDYPENTRQPIITTANSSGPPLAVAVIQTNPPGGEVAEYRTWVQETIVPRLERIKGVAGIRFVGGRDEEVHIDVDIKKLAALRLTVGDVSRAIRSELVDVSGGDIPVGKRRYLVRTQVAPPVPEQLERTVLKTGDNGTPVLLGQVANVHAGLRKTEAVGMVNGAPMMAMLFWRESGSNVLEVTEEIHVVVDQLQERYMAPEGLEIRIVSDQTDYIHGALDLVRQNLILGGILAMLVLLLFLRSFGASAVVALAIPISIVGTALAMSLMGRTVNVVSLAGMAFAVGMVVDNSIVVLENIDNWRRRERDISRAAVMGTREVWGAILASTLTTAAVFVPIISWQNEVGELLRDIAVAVSMAVFVSLIVSVIVIPSLSARLLRSRAPVLSNVEGPAETEPGEDDEEGAGESFGRIGSAAHWVSRSRVRSAVIATVGVVGVAIAGWLAVPPLEYLPTGNRNIVFGVVIPPTGTSVEEIERVGKGIQAQLLQHTGVRKDGVPPLDRSFFVGTPDQAFMGGVAENDDEVAGVAAYIRQVLRTVPDVIGFASQGSLFGRRLGGGRSIEIEITGADLGAMTRTAGMMMGALRAAMPKAQVRPIPSLDVGAPEFQVAPIRAQAAAFGMSSAEIGFLVDVYVDGAIIGELGAKGENKRDVVMRAVDVDITDEQALLNAPTATPTRDEPVSLRQFATVDVQNGPTVIQRIERRRALILQVSPPEDLALEEAVSVVRNEVVGGMMAKGQIPEGIELDYSGSAGELDDAKDRLFWVLLLAIIITYLLLAALFEDFLAPIAILVTVPLAGAGGVFGLRLVDSFLGSQSLDMLTAMGFVILIGVVVNNAILIVDGALSRMRGRGLSLEDAVASAVKWRVRPILMSALTSLAGLMPLVLFPGAGSELYRGVGGVVLGGLALSTALSLFLVPAVFTSLWRIRRALQPG